MRRSRPLPARVRQESALRRLVRARWGWRVRLAGQMSVHRIEKGRCPETYYSRSNLMTVARLPPFPWGTAGQSDDSRFSARSPLFTCFRLRPPCPRLFPRLPRLLIGCHLVGNVLHGTGGIGARAPGRQRNDGETKPLHCLTLSCGTPLPAAYSKPRLICAYAIPWSAARRNHLAASSLRFCRRRRPPHNWPRHCTAHRHCPDWPNAGTTSSLSRRPARPLCLRHTRHRADIGRRDRPFSASVRQISTAFT